MENNGLSLDPAVANDPSTTLANIRRRLEMICNGRLDIAPRKGDGTVVKVTVP